MHDLIRDIPRAYTALAECLGCLIYILLMPRSRHSAGLKIIPLSLAFLAAQSAFLVLTGKTRGIVFVLCMVAAFAMMFMFLRTALDLSDRDTVFRTAKAVMIAEAAASLEWQITAWLYWVSGHTTPVREALVLVLIYGAVFSGGYFLEKRLLQDRPPLRTSPTDAVMAVLLTLVIFAFSNLSFYAPGTPFSASSIEGVFIIRTLVDISGVAIMYAMTSRLYEMAAERELSEIRSMFRSQYDSYRSYQESMDLINLKYHDLKHQLDGLRGEEDPEKRKAWIDALEEELTDYRPKYRTGSPVLDAILEAKRVRMRNTGINFTCVADGSLLSFLHVTDICSIFGNALDNAVEAAASVPDPDRRLVHLSVSAKRSFLYIYVGNTCEGRAKLMDGLPLTTKGDRKSHGFGTKSLRYTVRKYQGTLSFTPKEDRFELTIMIPLPEDPGDSDEI